MSEVCTVCRNVFDSTWRLEGPGEGVACSTECLGDLLEAHGADLDR
ncbi:hypothetical protein [Natronococcus roseus]